MDALRQSHLVLVCFWGGFVLAEAVIELSSRTDDQLRAAARLHFLADICIEIPLLVAILVTGTLLTLRIWPPTPLHIVKIVSALIAIGANAVCVVFVIQRHRLAASQSHSPSSENAAQLRALHARVRMTGVGIPFGLVAAVIGFARFSG